MVMGSKSRILRKGTLLIIEEGAHDEFTRSDPVRMLGDYSKDDLVEQFKCEWKPRPIGIPATEPEARDFLPWLISSGKAEPVSVESWDIGDYRKFDPQ